MGRSRRGGTLRFGKVAAVESTTAGNRMKRAGAQLRLIPSPKRKARIETPTVVPFATLDLFRGAGGITEGSRHAGFTCLCGNDCMEEAVETFSCNHPEAWGDARDIELVNPADLGQCLGLAKGTIDIRVDGPPCMGFSNTAPERLWMTRETSLSKATIGSLKNSSGRPVFSKMCLGCFPKKMVKQDRVLTLRADERTQPFGIIEDLPQ